MSEALEGLDPVKVFKRECGWFEVIPCRPGTVLVIFPDGSRSGYQNLPAAREGVREYEREHPA